MPRLTVATENWFSPAEYRRRLQAVQLEMSRHDLDGLLVFSPANVYYLSGHHSIDSWEFRALVISPDRDPALLLFHFERGRFEASSWLDEAEYYGPGVDPVERLTTMISDLGLAGARIGVETNGPTIDGNRYRQLTGRLAQTKLVDIDRLVDLIRLRKSDEEIRAIERAAELTNLGVAAATEASTAGATDCEVAAAATEAMLRAGSHNPVMMPTVAVGRRSGLAHSEHDGAVIGAGDSVFLELSGCWRHYSAPVMKTLFIEPIDSRHDRYLDYASQMARALIETARPGVPACDVARAGWETIRPIQQEVQFHYNFGYSIGISFPPHWLEASGFYLTQDNPAELQSGMVFHLPLTLRVLGELAAGLSHTIVITDGGVRILTGDAR